MIPLFYIYSNVHLRTLVLLPSPVSLFLSCPFLLLAHLFIPKPPFSDSFAWLLFFCLFEQLDEFGLSLYGHILY